MVSNEVLMSEQMSNCEPATKAGKAAKDASRPKNWDFLIADAILEDG